MNGILQISRFYKVNKFAPEEGEPFCQMVRPLKLLKRRYRREYKNQKCLLSLSNRGNYREGSRGYGSAKK